MYIHIFFNIYTFLCLLVLRRAVSNASVNGLAHAKWNRQALKLEITATSVLNSKIINIISEQKVHGTRWLPLNDSRLFLGTRNGSVVLFRLSPADVHCGRELVRVMVCLHSPGADWGCNEASPWLPQCTDYRLRAARTCFWNVLAIIKEWGTKSNKRMYWNLFLKVNS